MSSDPEHPSGSAHRHSPAPIVESNTATTSLVLGLLSVMGLGFLTGIPAIIIGRRSTRKIDASGGALTGRGLATAGYVTGLIGTILSFLTLILVVILVFARSSVLQGG